jgi:hypothetical protein
MSAGFACRIRFARHVYHAGSRVGAVHVGCRMSFPPKMSRRRSANPTITHQEPRRDRVGTGEPAASVDRPFAVLVTAMLFVRPL